MRTILPQIESLQKPIELTAIEAEHLVLTLGPDKPVPLQALLPKAKPVAIPVEDLDHIPTTIAEGKQMSGEWIQLHVHLYQQAQTVDGLLSMGT